MGLPFATKPNAFLDEFSYRRVKTSDHLQMQPLICFTSSYISMKKPPTGEASSPNKHQQAYRQQNH
jgi:hypothetical protein